MDLNVKARRITLRYGVYKEISSIYGAKGDKDKQKRYLRVALQHYKKTKDSRMVKELERKLVELEYLTGKPIA